MTMMIKNMPTRYPEVGRIRLGQRDDNDQMEALSTFRFTSPDEDVIVAAAEQYGGVVEPWEARGEWQVVSEVSRIPILVPVVDPMYSAYEKWGSGGRQRACDGEMCTRVVMNDEGGHMEQVGCICEEEGWEPGDQQDVKKGACVPTLRLKVVQHSLPGVGIWMMTTSSKIAITEIPGQILFLQAMAAQNMLIPATLSIEQRTHKRVGEKFTRRYNVPTVRIGESLTAISQGAGMAAGALSGAAPVVPPTTLGAGGGAGAPALPAASREPQRAAAPDAPVPPPTPAGEGPKAAEDRRALAAKLISNLKGSVAKKWAPARNGMGIKAAPTSWDDEQVEQIIAWMGENGVAAD